MRPNGKPAEVHTTDRNGRAMDIHHNLAGGRRVEVERADHSRVVAYRGGHGYVQHPYMYHGHEYVSRTYVYNGRVYNRYYAGYSYRGVYMNVYSPGYYYASAFYGWAYTPWASPVAYSWGWGGNPWYGYYGFYFNPYPVYPSASAWLVDYMVSQSLVAAYQARAAEANAAAAQANAEAAAANAPPAGATAMTPQVKDMISAEVQRQIALENQEAQPAQSAAGVDPASSGLQRMMTDGVQHVFVAGRPIDVTDASNAECAITEGDALQLSGQTPADSTVAALVVLSSKGGQECRTGSTVTVPLTELQEMQNHMRETIDQGMGELQAKQGKGGLPALPASAAAPPVKAPEATAAPPPDPAAATEIAQESKQADQAEQQVLATASQDSGTATQAATNSGPAALAGPPPVLALGQTIDQVTAIQGQPKTIINLGATKKYVYADGVKVTFQSGKASNIE